MHTLRRAFPSALALALAAPVASAASAMPSPRPLEVRTPRENQSGPTLWSDPATWDHLFPAPGDSVHVPAGVDLILDVTPRPLSELRVDGQVTFADVPIRLGVDHVVVSGVFQLGTATAPHTQGVGILLSDRFHPQNHASARLFEVLPGGVLDIHGAPRSAAWLQLASNAAAGTSTIRLESPVDWRVRDRIVLASTDFDFEQAEERTIQSISPDRTVFTLDRPLDFLHWGSVQTLGVDERGEVALLNRNVRISGEGGGGGHLRFLSGGAGSTVRMSWAELDGLGVPGHLGRYPVHFHHFGDGTGSYVDSLSIHHSLNRAVALHATQNVRVTNCLAYETLGHAFFLEDGSERNNRLEGNLGLSTRSPAPSHQILPSDATPATFWLPSTGNQLIGNVAAGSEGHGFWYDIGHANHLVDAPTFDHNVAHSNGRNGYYKHDYRAVGSPLSTREFLDFTAYKNRGVGIYYRTADLSATWRGAHLADNTTGVFFGSTGTQVDGQNETRLVDSYIVGDSDNVGTPISVGELFLGRSLPYPNHPDEVLLGHEIYEGHNEFRGNTYANFQRQPVGGKVREAAALGHVRGANQWAIDPRTTVSGLHFIQAQPVYLEETPYLESGKAGLVLRDADGCLTGTPGRAVTASTALLAPASGSAHVSAWNANVLPQETRLANLRFTDRGGAGVETLTVASATRGAELAVGTANESYFATNVLVPDDYSLGFRAATAPRDFRLQLLFGIPGDSTIVTMRYPAPGPQSVRVDGNDATGAPSRTALENQSGSGFAYDATAGVLHVKLELRGTGTSIMDGLETRIDVMP